jgi:hypothetical protein
VTAGNAHRPSSAWGSRQATSSGNFASPAGKQALGWSEHHVVVKDGMVYDALTGREGMAAEAYKSLWQHGDMLRFDF